MSSRSVELVKFVIGAVLLVLVFAGPDMVGRMTAGSRVDPAVTEAMRTGRNLNLEVLLPKDHESFHIRKLESLGVFAGLDPAEGRARLMRVRPADARELVRTYWIREIRLMTG